MLAEEGRARMIGDNAAVAIVTVSTFGFPVLEMV